jgi:hypothetical protein
VGYVIAKPQDKTERGAEKKVYYAQGLSFRSIALFAIFAGSFPQFLLQHLDVQVFKEHDYPAPEYTEREPERNKYARYNLSDHRRGRRVDIGVGVCGKQPARPEREVCYSKDSVNPLHFQVSLCEAARAVRQIFRFIRNFVIRDNCCRVF